MKLKNIKHKLLIACTTVIIVICTFLNSHAKIYKWIDEDGNSHYTNIDPNAKKEIIIKNDNNDTEKNRQHLNDEQNKFLKMQEERRYDSAEEEEEKISKFIDSRLKEEYRATKKTTIIEETKPDEEKPKIWRNRHFRRKELYKKLQEVIGESLKTVNDND